MEPLPKIARERLQARRVAEHPDADLLTAFAEQALTTLERSQVADHLSHCADCRQIVVLATNAKPLVTETPLAARSSVNRRGMLSWPVLRWGALAACVVVVSAAGLLLTQRSFHRAEISPSRQPEKIATAIVQPSDNQPPAIAAQSSGSSVSADELKKQIPRSASRSDMVARSNLAKRVENRKEFLRLPDERADKKDADLLALAPGVAGKVLAEKPSQALAAASPRPSNSDQASLDAGPVGRAEQLANATPAAPADQKSAAQAIAKEEEPERPPAMSETVEVAAEAPQLQTQNTAVVAKSAKSKLETGRAENKSAASGAAHDKLAATAAITSGTRLMRDVNAAQWTLSSEGIPQRSFDSGKTWEKVQVDHHKTFRALSAQGMDVWVGGLAGTLYHSSDVGLHWTRIIPVTDSSTLTADVLTIDFRDPLHGKLTTSNQESWITSDAGKTWQKE